MQGKLEWERMGPLHTFYVEGKCQTLCEEGFLEGVFIYQERGSAAVFVLYVYPRSGLNSSGCLLSLTVILSGCGPDAGDGGVWDRG